jgi:hypothetical protein
MGVEKLRNFTYKPRLQMLDYVPASFSATTMPPQPVKIAFTLRTIRNQSTIFPTVPVNLAARAQYQSLKPQPAWLRSRAWAGTSNLPAVMILSFSYVNGERVAYGERKVSQTSAFFSSILILFMLLG